MSNVKSKQDLPSRQDEQLLDSVITNSPTIVTVRGRKFSIRWMRAATIRKVTEIMNRDGNDDRATCQCVAAFVLNDFWKMKFFWWILWRWMFYVRQYGDGELQPVIEEAKKKIPLREYLEATMYLTAMKDTMMQMTKKEANNILQEQFGGSGGKSAKTPNG